MPKTPTTTLYLNKQNVNENAILTPPDTSRKTININLKYNREIEKDTHTAIAPHTHQDI